MESNVLTSIPGIQYYPIVSLLLFFGLFATLIVWFFRADKARLNALAWAAVDDELPANLENSPTDHLSGFSHQSVA